MGTQSVFSINRQVTLAQKGPPDYTGVNLHTSTQSIPIPIMWGTRRISPNVLWQSSLQDTRYRLSEPLGPDVGGHGYDSAPFTMAGTVHVTNGSAGITFTAGQPGAAQGLELTFASQPGVVYYTTATLAPGWTTATLTTPYTGTTAAATTATYQLFAIGFGAYKGALGIQGGSLDQALYGAADSADQSSHWYVPMILGLCEGPIDSIPRFWNGGESAVASNVFPSQYGATFNPPLFYYTLFTGTTSQTAWSYFGAVNATPGGPYYSGQDLTYRNTAYIASALVDCGHGKTIPQQSFEVQRILSTPMSVTDSYGIGKDYCLADIISDILTSPVYGMGLLLTDIDATSRTAFIQYQFAQGLYFSPLLDAQAAAVDIIDRWAMQANTWIYWDGTKIVFAPLGDEIITGNGQTFTPDPTPAYNLTLDDFLDPGITVDRADPIDCYNRVRIEFPDRANDYSKNPIEWKDTTLINLYGIRDASNVSCDDTCDIIVAAKIVELLGKRMAYIRNHYTFTLSYRFIRVLPGTILSLTDPNLGLNLLPVRVVSVDEDEKGNLSIVAEEYPGSLGISRPLPAQTWSPTSGAAGGTSGAGGTPGSGPPVSTTPTGGAGGVPGIIATDPPVQWIFFVAGDDITLPASPIPGHEYKLTHDQQRSPQPNPSLLEANPAVFRRPAGATYTLEDPQDHTRTPATSCKAKTSGMTYRLALDANNVLRNTT